MICIPKTKIESSDHAELESYLPALKRAVSRAFTLHRGSVPHRDSQAYAEVFGRSQELLIDQSLKGKLTPSMVENHMHLRLLDYITENKTIRVPASTNRTRALRGAERIDFKFEDFKEHERNTPHYGIDPNYRHYTVAQWLIEREPQFVTPIYLTLYIFCTVDDIDRAIVNFCLQDFDHTDYAPENKIPQRQVAKEVGISTSQVQRRISIIKNRFKAIKFN